VLCYKFGYTLDYILSLTIPQIKILEVNLGRILKAETGESDEERVNTNTMALEGVAKRLKEQTGKSEFTMQELMNPAETLKKYKKV
jgi:hypothetical protein